MPTNSGVFRHGRSGQPPGAALFHDTWWGAARALRAAKRFSMISYHCAGNWHVGAPSGCRRPCSQEGALHRNCEKGARGTVHLCVFPNGTDKGGDWNPYWSLQGYAITYGGLRSLSCPATTLYETLNSTTTAHHHPNRQQTKSRKAYRNYR